MARILIVDNSDPVRKTLAALLESQGHRVSLAADGEQALGSFAAVRFDAVLMDVYSPGIDGLETCRRLREASQVPILMTSSVEDPLIYRRALICGADAFMAKPLELDSLLAWLERMGASPNGLMSDGSLYPN